MENIEPPSYIEPKRLKRLIEPALGSVHADKQ